MASGTTHPYIKAVSWAAAIFFALIALLILLGLYVHSKSIEEPDIAPAMVEKNLAPPGKIYPRP